MLHPKMDRGGRTDDNGVLLLDESLGHALAGKTPAEKAFSTRNRY